MYSVIAVASALPNKRLHLSGALFKGRSPAGEARAFSNRNNNDEKIGAAGELLVQYKLVKEEIDSARLTTDAGVDLVAYSPNGSKAYTIQIKTKEQ